MRVTSDISHEHNHAGAYRQFGSSSSSSLSWSSVRPLKSASVAVKRAHSVHCQRWTLFKRPLRGLEHSLPAPPQQPAHDDMATNAYSWRTGTPDRRRQFHVGRETLPDQSRPEEHARSRSALWMAHL